MKCGMRNAECGIKRQPWIRLLCALLVACLALPAARSEEKPVAAKTVKFELLKSRHMAVQVKINGKGPFRLIFDTGAPAIIINNKIAKEAGVLSKDTKKPPFAMFGAMGQFPLKSLEVGDVKVEDASAMIVDHPTVEALSQLLGPIDGIVGFPFFARFRTTIDYQAKVMTLTPVNYKPGDLMQTLMATMMEPSSPSTTGESPSLEDAFIASVSGKGQGAGDDG